MVAQLNLKHIARVSGDNGSNNFGSANTTADIHIIPDSARHHYTGRPAGAKYTIIPPQLATFMEILDNSMDIHASTVTNNKTVMYTLVTNNKIITATNAKLVATNSTFASSGVSVKPPGSSGAHNPNYTLKNKTRKKWAIGRF